MVGRPGVLVAVGLVVVRVVLDVGIEVVRGADDADAIDVNAGDRSAARACRAIVGTRCVYSLTANHCCGRAVATWQARPLACC
jgi:hypothetical protein